MDRTGSYDLSDVVSITTKGTTTLFGSLKVKMWLIMSRISNINEPENKCLCSVTEAHESSKFGVGMQIPAWVQLVRLKLKTVLNVRVLLLIFMGMWCKWSARMFEAHQDTVQFCVFPLLTNTI